VVAGSATKALECGCAKRECEWCGQIWKLLDAIDAYIPTAGPAHRPAVFDGDRGRVHDHGAWDGGDGRVERGVVKVSDEVEIVGLHPQPRRTVATGVEMFRKLLDQGQAGTTWGYAAGDRPGGCGAGAGAGEAWDDHAAHEV